MDNKIKSDLQQRQTYRLHKASTNIKQRWQQTQEPQDGAMKLIFNNVWDDLLSIWHQSPRHIAVAYFSSDDDLPFSPDDQIVVDASDGAIASGQTSAAVLQRAVEAGAAVFSLENLHAKVFALGHTLVVGSANASKSSRQSLIECVAFSENPHAVAEGIAFVKELAKQASQVDKEFLRRITQIPVKQKIGRGLRRKPVTVRKPRCWLLGFHPAGYPGNEKLVNKKNKKVARSVESKQEEADWFWWPKNKSKFVTEARPGDLVVQVWSPVRGNCPSEKIEVYRHGRLCDITQEEGVNAKVYHAAWPANAWETCLGWDDFRSLLAKVGWNVEISRNSCREIPEDRSRLLAELWP